MPRERDCLQRLSLKVSYMTSWRRKALKRRHLQDVVLFHAGTSQSGSDVVTTGGRVMAVTASAPTLQGALDAAYAGVEAVSFEGKVYRRDIAHR